MASLMFDRSYLDGWTTHAEHYSAVERMTAPLALELSTWVNAIHPFSTPGARALDNGCGGGTLSKAIKQIDAQIPLLSTDVAAGMVAQTVKRAAAEGGWIGHEARVVDARELAGIPDGSVSHPMSQYMISLAPEGDRIAREMYRVMKPGGVLGLGTWGGVNFSCWSDPWTVAARETMPGYKCPALMASRWVVEGEVKLALEEAGFKGVETRFREVEWEWDGVAAIMHYIFEEANPGVEFYKKDFVAKGGDLEDIRPRYERVLRKTYEKEPGKGPVFVPVQAILAIGRK